MTHPLPDGLRQDAAPPVPSSSDALVQQLRCQLETAERRLAMVQAVADLGSWQSDADGQHLHFTEHTHRVLGLDPGIGPIGRATIRSRVHPDDLPVLRAARDRLLAGEAVTTRFRFRRDDGQEVWLESRATFEPARGDRPPVLLGTVRDVSDQVRLQHDLERRRDRLEELVVSRTVQLAEASERAEAAGRAKSAFLAHTSHEVRTPLNVTVSLSHPLGRSEGDPARRLRLQAVEEAARHLSSIVDDLLDLARAEGSRMTLRRQPLSPDQLLNEAATVLAPLAAERGHVLMLRPPSGSVPPLAGDGARLRQALLNAGRAVLTGTGRGTVVLGLVVDAVQDGRASVRLEVRGPTPLSPDAFEGDTNLVALQRLARVLGGAAGQRADGTIWLTAGLDLVDEQPASGPPDAEQAIRQRHVGRTVLLAEDDAVNQMVMRELLLDVGLRVDVADDGQEAVARASERGYALVVLDLRMPRLDGLSAARALRALPAHRDTPLIAITANAFEEDRNACRVAGMNDFLPKPVDVQRLYQVLLHWLDAHAPTATETAAPGPAPAAMPQGPAPALPAASAEVSVPATAGAPVAVQAAPPHPALDHPLIRPLLALEGLDAMGGLSSVGGRPELYRRLLTLFVDTHRLDGARLHELVDQRRFDEAGALAHRMRGSSATLGLVDVETACAALEHGLDGPDGPALAGLLAQDVAQALRDTLDRLTQALVPA